MYRIIPHHVWKIRGSYLFPLVIYEFIPWLFLAIFLEFSFIDFRRDLREFLGGFVEGFTHEAFVLLFLVICSSQTPGKALNLVVFR